MRQRVEANTAWTGPRNPSASMSVQVTGFKDRTFVCGSRSRIAQLDAKLPGSLARSQSPNRRCLILPRSRVRSTKRLLRSMGVQAKGMPSQLTLGHVSRAQYLAPLSQRGSRPGSVGSVAARARRSTQGGSVTVAPSGLGPTAIMPSEGNALIFPKGPGSPPLSIPEAQALFAAAVASGPPFPETREMLEELTQEGPEMSPARLHAMVQLYQTLHNQGVPIKKVEWLPITQTVLEALAPILPDAQQALGLGPRVIQQLYNESMRRRLTGTGEMPSTELLDLLEEEALTHPLAAILLENMQPEAPAEGKEESPESVVIRPLDVARMEANLDAARKRFEASLAVAAATDQGATDMLRQLRNRGSAPMTAEDLFGLVMMRQMEQTPWGQEPQWDPDTLGILEILAPMVPMAVTVLAMQRYQQAKARAEAAGTMLPPEPLQWLRRLQRETPAEVKAAKGALDTRKFIQAFVASPLLADVLLRAVDLEEASQPA